MKSKAIIPLLVGVGIGLLALKMGWNYVEESRLSAAASQGDTPVVVASRSVPPGTPLRLDDLTIAQWPRSAVPSGVCAEREALVGRVSLTSLSAELPILENMLAPPGTAPGLPALIPPGYQAMAVKVDEFGGVSGFLKPGDKVDVVATFNVKRSKSEPTETVTRTILRDITVSTVGQTVQPDENQQATIVRSVTLLVKPLQAQRLSLASTRGTIRLSLRSGRSQDSVTALPAITFAQLLRSDSENGRNGKATSISRWMKSLLKSKKAPPRAAPVKVDPRWQIQIFRGSATEEIIFENAHSSRRIEPGSTEQKTQGMPAKFQKYQGLNQQDKAQILKDAKDEFFGE